MATTTYTGVLTDLRGQVSISNGVDQPLLLALRGEDNPIASAAGAFAKYGQTDPVTVSGDMGQSGNFTVLFVTSIQPAADSDDVMATAAVPQAAAAPQVEAAPAPVAKKKSAAKKAARKSH
jgi:hypothetical protein